MAEETTGSHGSDFRRYLPDLTTPRFQAMQKQDAREYAALFKMSGNPPWLHGLYLHWMKLFKEPFKGITNDGVVRPDLFKLQDEGIPITAIVEAAQNLLDLCTPEQRAKLSHHIDSPEWRSWSNPEFLLSDKGLRIDETSPELQEAVTAVFQLSLSEAGFKKAIGATDVNGFLGELVGAPRVLGYFSYNFVLFGEPAVDAPWGISLYGHHLCLNILFYETQIVVSPCFTGAEPNVVDEGECKGTRILEEEEVLGLKLMQSLPKVQQGTAQVYKLMRDPAMPKGRWNHDDQRHLCGAYRDNRVVPYEGVLVSKMTEAQQELVMQVLEQFLIYLPDQARKMRLQQAQEWFHETYFCWIGGFGDDDPFYYRIQSPVIIVEFDHHSGVFLTNKEPAKFHIHTLLRTPNGGDYGMALRPLMKGMEQEFVWAG